MISANLVKELREKSGAGMLDCKKALEACNGDINESMEWLRKKGISKAEKKADRIAAEGLASILVKGNEAVIVEINSETDFVAKNEEFTNMVSVVLETLMNGNASTVEEALELSTEDGTLNDLIVNKTAKIGEKLSLRRFVKVSKTDSEAFGEYIHMGGKIAVLTIIDGGNSEVAKDVAMHAAAMKPTYVKRENVPTAEVENERSVLKEQAMNEGKSAEIAEKMIEGRMKKFYEQVCLEEQAFIKDGDISVGTYVKNNNGTIVNMVRYEVGEGMEKREEDFAAEVAKQING